MPVTVLVFRETLSLEHLVKLMIHFINFWLRLGAQEVTLSVCLAQSA